MRSLPTRWPRRTVLLTIAALAGLALPATVALAVESPMTPTGPCEAELATFTREGVSGDAHAVALTAQAIDRDTDGWLLLAWEAADGTRLTDVLATAPDGTSRHLEPTPTGTVEHVATLTFCGTHTTPAPVTEPAAPVTEPAAPAEPSVPAEPAAPAEPTADAAVGDAAEAPARVDERDRPNAHDRQHERDRQHQRDGQREGGPDEPRDDRSVTTGDSSDQEVEVLGARLVGPLAAPRTGTSTGLGRDGATGGEEAHTLALAGSERPVAGLDPWLLIAAVGAGLAAGGTLLRARTRLATATNPTSSNGPEAGS